MTKNIFLVSPRGFCAGVRRAIATVEKCLKQYAKNSIYVYHDIVHNTHVVNDFKNRGVKFVEDINLIPKNSVVIFSAHGVEKRVEKEAKQRHLKVVDATCPLVTKIHRKAEKFTEENCAIILIGHRNHVEVIGTLGQLSEAQQKNVFIIESVTDAKNFDQKKLEKCTKIQCLSQTTFSVDQINQILEILQDKIPSLRTNNDICYATTNRQEAVKYLAKKCELVLVVGSKHSSNSQRLKELATEYGAQSLLIDDFKLLQKDYTNILQNLESYENIGITAGASAPEFLVNDLVDNLRKILNDSVNVQQLECDGERPDFTLPSGL
ncbi:4-hydroxy-3-methylbut-2-enyl diphosphate reductase [Lentisphaerota bacterium WC36G]|nr:4-hydroxy-3-methylbut-2-enyl diphosphate reductase [Lentisphaerae bacterium WC36]